MGVLDLEPTDIILKKESEGAIIYTRAQDAFSYCLRRPETGRDVGDPPECAPARVWPSFNNDVLIEGYDSSRRLWRCSLILSSKNISSRSRPSAMARITTQ
jgi:hypothetical protein